MIGFLYITHTTANNNGHRLVCYTQTVGIVRQSTPARSSARKCHNGVGEGQCVRWMSHQVVSMSSCRCLLLLLLLLCCDFFEPQSHWDRAREQESRHDVLGSPNTVGILSYFLSGRRRRSPGKKRWTKHRPGDACFLGVAVAR